MTFLTRQEKYVIVFLILGAICGLSYSYYKKFHPPIDIRFRRKGQTLPLRGITGQVSDPEKQGLDHLLKEAKSVNINRAQASELMKLKGIGPVLAHRIIVYRKTHGSFKNKDELKKITGIGPKKFDAIKDYILIE